MTKPHIAGRAPIVETLQPGTYAWCACGLSKSQPFCDGSHAGTGIEPVEFVIEAEKRCALCMCKHSRNKPMCDGFHKFLPPA